MSRYFWSTESSEIGVLKFDSFMKYSVYIYIVATISYKSHPHIPSNPSPASKQRKGNDTLSNYSTNDHNKYLVRR